MYQKERLMVYIYQIIFYIKTYCNKQMELDAEQSSGVVGVVVVVVVVVVVMVTT